MEDAPQIQSTLARRLSARAVNVNSPQSEAVSPSLRQGYRHAPYDYEAKLVVRPISVLACVHVYAIPTC